MESIELPRMAQALSCPPRTLCRMIHSLSAARSLQKAPVSLERAARGLQMDQKALSQFLTDILEQRDQALTPELAQMVLGLSRSVFYRYFKEGKIPAIIHVGRFSRFSLEALKQLSLG